MTASQRTKRAEVGMMQRFDVYLPDEYQLHTVSTCKESKPSLFWAAYSDGWCRPVESHVDLFALIERGFRIPPSAACVMPKVAHAFSMATKCDHFFSIAIDNGFTETLTLDRMWVEVFLTTVSQSKRLSARLYTSSSSTASITAWSCRSLPWLRTIG